MSMIHATAIIDATANIHPSVSVGPYSIIGPHVTIAADTVIGPHVVVTGWTRIGARNRIFQFASIGAESQDLKYKGEESWLDIGDDNVIREACSLHRGTVQDQGITRIGNHNLLMVNTHIAHDCQIGNHCILANNVGIAGHVVVENNVIIGGNSGIHQFCRLGAYSMIGGGSVVLKDVPAYIMVAGNPAAAHGMNYEGMRRRGWSSETIQTLREAYKVVYKSHLTRAQCIAKLEQDILPQAPEVALLIDSLQKSSRGIIR